MAAPPTMKYLSCPPNAFISFFRMVLTAMSRMTGILSTFFTEGFSRTGITARLQIFSMTKGTVTMM